MGLSHAEINMSNHKHPKQYPEIQEAAPSLLIALSLHFVKHNLCSVRFSCCCSDFQNPANISRGLAQNDIPKDGKSIPLSSPNRWRHKNTHITLLSFELITTVTVYPLGVKKETNRNRNKSCGLF